MPLLTQFILRLAFGLALAMALTSPRRVTSGYFRNHLYVLLGLNVLSALIAVARPAEFSLWPPLVGAIVSYLGAVFWLYEKPLGGIASLWIVAVADLIGAWLGTPALSAVERSSDPSQAGSIASWLLCLDPVTGGLLLGSTIAAMFLGHWYLNTPTMEMKPLRRLLKLMSLALLLRATVALLGLLLLISNDEFALNLPLLVLRWIAGLISVAGVIWMTWVTLKIPNTQAATGMLYVAVILTFLGELVAQLLSQESPYPV